MKKSGLLMLLLACFLMAMPVVASIPEIDNGAFALGFTEIKINVQEEVAGVILASEIVPGQSGMVYTAAPLDGSATTIIASPAVPAMVIFVLYILIAFLIVNRVLSVIPTEKGGAMAFAGDHRPSF
jgi:hypothetical protein